MSLITIRLWLAFSFFIFLVAPNFSYSQYRNFFQRPRQGKYIYSFAPSIGFENIYLNDRFLSYSTYATNNLFYKIQASFIASRYDVAIDFKYSPQKYNLHQGSDLQRILDDDTYEINLYYRHYFSKYSHILYVGGGILGSVSARETNIYDTRFFIGEAFLSGLVSFGYIKKFNRFAFLAHIELPVLSYVFGARYDVTHPFYTDERLLASQAVPRNVIQRENEILYLLSSAGSVALPHQFFYGLGRASLVYSLSKGWQLSFNYELRYTRFQSIHFSHSYSRLLSVTCTYVFR